MSAEQCDCPHGFDLHDRFTTLEKALEAAQQELEIRRSREKKDQEWSKQYRATLEENPRLRAEVEAWKLNTGRLFMACVRNGVPELETDEAMNLKDTEEALKALRASKSSQDRGEK